MKRFVEALEMVFPLPQQFHFRESILGKTKAGASQVCAPAMAKLPEGVPRLPAGVCPRGHSQTHSAWGEGAQRSCQSQRIRHLECESEGGSW